MILDSIHAIIHPASSHRQMVSIILSILFSGSYLYFCMTFKIEVLKKERHNATHTAPQIKIMSLLFFIITAQVYTYLCEVVDVFLQILVAFI